MVVKRSILTAVMFMSASVAVFGQVELSGSWAAKNHEDALERLSGPHPVDFAGLPLNESGRAKALSYSPSELSMPERICAFYSPWYLMLGPFGLKIWSETDPVTGKIATWNIGSWEDRAPIMIWMDGRPHPSQNAPHSKSGFTTGVWEGDVLTTTTTHMFAGYARRNGAPISDQATMTAHFIRHDDRLTIAAQLEDPVYLSEPYYLTRTFVSTSAPVNAAGPPCIVGDEGVSEGTVPHYLPGKNPLMDEMMKVYNIPPEAALGGKETMYPAFRDKIKDRFTIPPKCARNCGGPPAN